ncbi:MAG TPA: hypothetical protein VMW27_06415 [Thermoanaerobaculia bacterium]|nr:hypothetical protein [Thermoanaerobaculia bacterium]
MTSNYQLFKLWFTAVLPLAKDAIHIYVGFLCLLVSLLLLRLRLTSFWSLVPGLVVSLLMEALDLRDGYAWAESAKDLINTNLIPFLFVLLARWRVINI